MDRLYTEVVQNAGSHSAVLGEPADIFAVCANLAKVTSCYLEYASPEKSNIVESKDCVADGKAWLRALDAQFMEESVVQGDIDNLPRRVVSSWKRVGSWLQKAAAKPSDIRRPLKPGKDVESAVLYLIATADEACGGLGLPDGGGKSFFGFISNLRLARRGTLCRYLDPSRLRVLPKQHTPKFGLNLRNLTHHLAYCENPEVGVRWNQNAVLGDERVSFNILLVPWPFNVLASDIGPAERISSSPSVGYFDCSPKKSAQGCKEVLKLVASAEARGQRVDLIVLPECALDEAGWKNLSTKLLQKKISLLSGVAGRSDRSIGTNSVRLKVPGNPGDLLTQHKHHRWKIEKNQIRNYGLGGTLSCGAEWWENIELTTREVNFFAFSRDLVVCPLICEDLARQDPVADVVRSVGPNLVIALLMDGPQLSNRWSARYASVLADDPGSSVLTLSSLGMVNLSRPPAGADSRQVIASWKESQGGFVEICLPLGHFGALLNVQFTRELEQTVDGRGDNGVASTPVLAGVHYV